MSGVSAWLIWLFIHLMYLVEFRSRHSLLGAFSTWPQPRRGWYVGDKPADASEPGQGRSLYG
jgi:hypothetical protein